MLEVDAAHRFPFVLSGTRVNALACAEQKGRSFLELWAPQEQRTIAAMLLTVMDASCPVLATAIAAPEGWPNHEIEILFLPLGRPGHERARILGLISPSAAPSWLGLRPAKNMSLASLHPVGSENAARPFEVRDAFCLGSGCGCSAGDGSTGEKTLFENFRRRPPNSLTNRLTSHR